MKLTRPLILVTIVALLVLTDIARSQARPTTAPSEPPAPSGTPAAALLDAAAMVPPGISIFPLLHDPGVDELIENDWPLYGQFIDATTLALERREFGHVPGPVQCDDVQRLTNVAMLRAIELHRKDQTDEAADLILAGLCAARYIGQFDTYDAKRREIDVSQSAIQYLARMILHMSPAVREAIEQRVSMLPPMIAPADVVRADARRLLTDAEVQDEFFDDGSTTAPGTGPAVEQTTPEQVQAVSELLDAVAQVISTRPDEMRANVEKLFADLRRRDAELAERVAPLKSLLIDFGEQCTGYEVRLDLLKAAFAVGADGGIKRLGEFRDYFGKGPFEHHSLPDGGFELLSAATINGNRIRLSVPAERK